MNYLEAVKSLMAGKFVTRKTKTWDDEGAYLTYLPGMENFVRVTTIPRGQPMGWVTNIEHSIAEDYAEIELNTLLNPVENKDQDGETVNEN